MIGALMAYAFWVSALIGVAALGTERLFALRGWPRRVLWAFALSVSFAFPCLMALTTHARGPQVITDVPISKSAVVGKGEDLPGDHATESAKGALLREAAATRDGSSLRVGLPAPDRSPPISSLIERLVRIVWPASSIAVVLLYGLAWLRLKRVVSRCPLIRLDGGSVRVTHGMGPAVFGFFHPEILLPQWLVEAQPSVRAPALAHERAHIAAHDPLLLFGALALVALAPWNPVLWWQLRCLRFGIEADCDARVLKSGTDAVTYSNALLMVGQQRTPVPVGFMALITRTSSLERRIRIMLEGTGRLGRLLAGMGVTVAVGLLPIVVSLRAPGLAAAMAAPTAVPTAGGSSGELRKLPPEDTKPSAEWARTAARDRFPELFRAGAQGRAELGMVFTLDGSVVLADKHPAPMDRFLPLNFRLAAEKARLRLDEEDILYYDQIYLEAPQGGTAGDAVYAVLKWPHDPARSEARVQAALETERPELRETGERTCIRMMVLMNDDGTIKRARSWDHTCGSAIPDDRELRLTALGATSADLGRGGTFTTKPPLRPVSIDYLWPQHADDPSDIVELVRGRVNADVWMRHPMREDTRDDAEIAARYFPDLQRSGKRVFARVIGGYRYQVTPWVLFGRDGRIWQTGRSLIMALDPRGFSSGGMPLAQELQGRYPGIRVEGSQRLPETHGGILYVPLWIAPDSPVQRREEVDTRRAGDLLLNADFIVDVVSSQPDSPRQVGVTFAHTMNFDTPSGIGLSQYVSDTFGPQPGNVLKMRVKATAVDANTVALEVQTRDSVAAVGQSPPGHEWVSAGTLYVPYGAAGAIDLVDSSMAAPPFKSHLVLRPQRLREQL